MSRRIGNEPSTCGIYEIRNRISGSAYRGQARNIHKRVRWHFARLRANKHTNARLQASYNKHGAEAFECLVIAEVPTDTEQRILNELERISIVAMDPAIRCNFEIDPDLGTMDEEARKRWLIAVTRANKVRAGDPTWRALQKAGAQRAHKSDASRRAHSEANRRRYADPEYRKKHAAALAARNRAQARARTEAT